MDDRKTQAVVNLLVILLVAVIILLFLLPDQIKILQDATGNFIRPYGDEYGIGENVQGIIADFSVYVCPVAFIIAAIVAWVLYSSNKEA